MRNNVTGSSPRSGGCGCGGSGPECHCGKASCDQCRLEGFVRPRFFPGQLLTEEDLHLLDAYTVAKNRLHNRYFWGDGVVCGLEVSPHPCDKGSVVVSAGYALDCCGNDIVVACKQDLDVNRLVRDLRTSRKGGYDCGDPCAEKDTSRKTSAAKAVAAPSGPDLLPPNKPGDTTADDRTEKPVGAKYCLYVTYCESESDPVAPYSTGDQCGGAGCEPSRVREGFRFELRCEEDGKPRPSIETAICKCIRDEDKIAKSAQSVAVTGFLKRRYTNAAMYLRHPSDADAAERLQEANRTLAPMMVSEIDDAWVAGNLDAALEASEAVITYTARLLRGDVKAPPALAVKLGASSKKKAAATSGKTPVEETGDADAVHVGGPLPWIARLPADPLVRKELAENRTEAERANVEAIASKAELLLRAEKSRVIDEAERKRLAAGLIITNPLTEATERLMADVAGDLQFAPGSMPPSLPRVETLPSFSTTDPAANAPAAARFEQTANRLSVFSGRVVDDYRDCFCRSVLPPCSVCEDQSVLIACVEVLDCEVVDICNLVRRFVLTPRALRYWLPDIERLGESLEEFCCGESGRQGRFWRVLAQGVSEKCVEDPQAAKKVAVNLTRIYGDTTSPTSVQAPAVASSTMNMLGLTRIRDLESRILKLEELQRK